MPSKNSETSSFLAQCATGNRRPLARCSFVRVTFKMAKLPLTTTPQVAFLLTGKSHDQRPCRRLTSKIQYLFVSNKIFRSPVTCHTILMHEQKRSLCLQWLVSPLNWYLFAVLSAVGEFMIKKRSRRILICKTHSKSQSIWSAPGLQVFSSSNIVADTLVLLGTFYRHSVSRNIATNLVDYGFSPINQQSSRTHHGC